MLHNVTQCSIVEETSKKEAIGEKRPLKEEDEEEGEATAPSAKKLCVASEEEPAISDTQPTRSEPEGEEAAAAAVKPERGDSIEETLICQICQVCGLWLVKHACLVRCVAGEACVLGSPRCVSGEARVLGKMCGW